MDNQEGACEMKQLFDARGNKFLVVETVHGSRIVPEADYATFVWAAGLLGLLVK